MDLFADVEPSLDKDLASPEAQAFADCWTNLVEQFTGFARSRKVSGHRTRIGRTGRKRLVNMKPFENAQVWAYMDRVMAARQ